MRLSVGSGKAASKLVRYDACVHKNVLVPNFPHFLAKFPRRKVDCRNFMRTSHLRVIILLEYAMLTRTICISGMNEYSHLRLFSMSVNIFFVLSDSNN